MNDGIKSVMFRYMQAFEAANGRKVQLNIMPRGMIRVGTGGLEYTVDQLSEMARRLELRTNNRHVKTGTDN